MFFSVIVPVYQAEKYLKKCIESILRQKFDDFELILIDDGSTDAYPLICDSYAKSDSRVRVIHKKNEGQARARKEGIRMANGDYVVYVDADDWVASSLLKDAYTLIKEHSVEMVSFAYTIVEENPATGSIRIIEKEPVEEGYYNKEMIERCIFPLLLMDADSRSMSYTLWGKAICRSLLYKFQMEVDDRTLLCEDITCVVPLYLNVQNLFVSHKSEYFYRYSDESCCHSFKMAKYRELIIGVQHMERITEKTEFDFRAQLDRYTMNTCFNMLAAAARLPDSRRYEEIVRWMNHPVLRRHITGAKIRQCTFKTRISYFFMRMNRIKFTLLFLKACETIKKYSHDCV